MNYVDSKECELIKDAVNALWELKKHVEQNNLTYCAHIVANMRYKLTDLENLFRINYKVLATKEANDVPESHE